MSDITILQIILANLALAAGACLQGLAGYGIGTLSAPLMFLISPSLVPGVMMLQAVLINLLMLIRNRQGVQFRPVRHAVAGSVVGTLLAAATLVVLSAQGFKLIFGVLILLAVGLSVIGIRPALTPRNSVIAGGVSGYMGTITAVGGPPIALIYQSQQPMVVRGNLSAFFLFSTLLALLALIFSGYIGLRELKLAALMCPGVFVGFWASGHLLRHLRLTGLRPLVLSIAAISGLTAIITAIFSA